MTPIKPTIWSYDDGYGDNKLTDGVEELIIPSYATTYRPRLKQEIDALEKPNPDDYIVIEYDNGRKYIVGKGAVAQDSKASAMLGNNKHLDKRFIHMFRACLGRLAKKEDNFVDVLIMGLPVNAEEDPERHELLRKLILNETHSFTLHMGDGTSLRRNIQIKELVIKKQPFGSICDVMLDEDGEFVNKDIAAGYNVIADIGAGTFNVYTLNNLEPVSDLSFNTNDGMFTAYEEVNLAIEEMTGDKVPDAKLPEIVNVAKEIQGESLEYAIDDAFDNLANTCVGVIEKSCKNSWSLIKRVIWTGGGTELLKDKIEHYMPKRNKVFLGRFSTARGLRKFAVRNYNLRLKDAKNKHKEEATSA